MAIHVWQSRVASLENSAGCAPWRLHVVSDLIPEHHYLPSSTLAVSAHLHVHGREAPRSTGRNGQWTTEWLVELKLDGGLCVDVQLLGTPLVVTPPRPLSPLLPLAKKPPALTNTGHLCPCSVLHGVRSVVTVERAAEAGSSPNSPPGYVSLAGPQPPSSLRGVRPCSPRSLRDQCTLRVDKNGSLRHGLYSSLRVFFVECAVLCW